MRTPAKDTGNQVHARQASRAGLRCGVALLALSAILFAPGAHGAGQNANQNQKKNNKKDADTAPITSPIAAPDAQAIDTVVSQMLGAWQIGDVEMMHKYYADDVVVISGVWEPPLIGWDNYVRAYQSQRARTALTRLERSNTGTKVLGESAFVTYQWQFTGQVDGAPTTAFGHTTLALEKRGGVWVIILNHTSTVPAPAMQTSPQSAPGMNSR